MNFSKRTTIESRELKGEPRAREDEPRKLQADPRGLQTAPIEIKDLMLGELLCQAEVISDEQLLRIAGMARSSKATLGAVLVFSGIMNSSELFLSRRVLNRFLNDQDNLDRHLQTLTELLSCSSTALTRPRNCQQPGLSRAPESRMRAG